jgi:hypothetical protein
VSLDTAIKNNEAYIGWSDEGEGDAELLIKGKDYSRERVATYLDTFEWFREKNNHYKGKSKAALSNFLLFKKGDYLIIPKPGEYAVAEVLDDLPFLSTAVPNTFARKVKFLLNKDRNLTTSRTVTYAKLTTTMGQQWVLCWIGDETHKKAIDELLSHGVKDISIQLREKATHAFLEHLHSPMSNMDANKLEVFTQRLLRKLGAQSVEVVARINDIGADVIGEFPLLDIRIGVQCKYHVYGQTDEYAVEQIWNALEKDIIDFGWVISLAHDFSEAAKEKAKLGRIRLINGSDLAALILDIGLFQFEPTNFGG